jgi:hypothetical protein
MYSACLYCSDRFGANEAVEQFPLGRRLAFDAALGRLWVICARCRRWNLSPLEERWEAIEQCERLYRGTPLKASTDHIGLAKLGEGLELVRIGAPTRPEFAAWRYGGEFARRRKRTFTVGASVLAATVGYYALEFSNPGLAAAIPAAGLLPQFGNYLNIYFMMLRPVATLQLNDGKQYTLRAKDVTDTKIEPASDGAPWRLNLLHGQGRTILSGPEAKRILGRVMSQVNLQGGKPTDVESALQRLVSAGSASRFLAQTAQESSTRVIGNLSGMSIDTRLALEMALHEDTERAALEGDLAALEAAWKDAEEIAAIADRLLLPSWLNERVTRLRGGGEP